MDQLSRILLNMDTRDPHHALAVRRAKAQRAVFTERNPRLRDLIRLWQIGVKILLSVGARPLRDLTLQRRARHDGKLHRAAVERGKCSRESHTDRTALRIGFGSKSGGASAEYLAFGLQLGMDL